MKTEHTQIPCEKYERSKDSVYGEILRVEYLNIKEALTHRRRRERERVDELKIRDEAMDKPIYLESCCHEPLISSSLLYYHPLTTT